MKRVIGLLLALAAVFSTALARPAAAAEKETKEEEAVREKSPEWVAELDAAQDAEQLFIVAGVGKTTAFISMHEKDGKGVWRQIMTTPGFIGRNGLGKTREGDGRTPVGVFGFNRAFGIAEDPGCALDYLQVTDEHYWSGDQREGHHYNELVSIRELPGLDRSASEHIVEYDTHYQYCLNISYNDEGAPGRGSAIFLHCFDPGRPMTGGCVAIPKEKMITVMRNVRPGCVVLIDTLKTICPALWQKWGLDGTEDLTIGYGRSERFTIADRDAAIAVIRAAFERWDGCVMHSLRYAGDEFSTEENAAWLREHEGAKEYVECICFLSDFRSPAGGGGAWEPDAEYADWGWWLGRTEGGEWELVDSGH